MPTRDHIGSKASPPVCGKGFNTRLAAILRRDDSRADRDGAIILNYRKQGVTDRDVWQLFLKTVEQIQRSRSHCATRRFGAASAVKIVAVFGLPLCWPSPFPLGKCFETKHNIISKISMKWRIASWGVVSG
jgi:hypothetical protein